MTKERTQYTAPDEVTQLRRQVAQLDERLEAARKTIDGFTDASSYQWWAYRQRIDELEQTVQRLEADNRRLRRLDAMPLDALRTVCMNSEYAPHIGNMTGCTVAEFVNCRDELVDYLAGDA